MADENRQPRGPPGHLKPLYGPPRPSFNHNQGMYQGNNNADTSLAPNVRMISLLFCHSV